jgi:hypothetical protein
VTREEDIARMRARHSIASRLEDGYPVTGPWSFRPLCEHQHGWMDVDEHWLQCRVCWWCKPKLGDPPELKLLPAILRGRVLPPLSGKVNLHKLYANAGFVLDDDRDSVLSVVRVRVMQHARASREYLEVRRCGAEVKFQAYGWREAAVFMETGLTKLLSVLARAEPRKPKALWSQIQSTYETNWRKPWEARA